MDRMAIVDRRVNMEAFFMPNAKKKSLLTVTTCNARGETALQFQLKMGLTEQRIPKDGR